MTTSRKRRWSKISPTVQKYDNTRDELRIITARLVRRALFQPQFRQIADHYAVISGVLFIASAFLQASLMFWRLNINYFHVANGQDIVIKGLHSIGLVFAFFVIFGFGTLILYFPSELVRHTYSALRRGVKTRIISRAAASWRQEVRIGVDFANTLLLSVLIGFMALLLEGSYPTHIYYTGGGNLKAECVGSSVVWLGTDSAIIRCGESSVVIKGLENVIFVHNRRTRRPSG